MMSWRTRNQQAEFKNNNIMKAIEVGIRTETIKDLEAEKGRLQDGLYSEEMRQRIQLKQDDILRYLDSLDDYIHNSDDQTKILYKYVDRVIVTDDEVAVILRYTSGRRAYPSQTRSAHLRSSGRAWVCLTDRQLVMRQKTASERY